MASKSPVSQSGAPIASHARGSRSIPAGVARPGEAQPSALEDAPSLEQGAMLRGEHVLFRLGGSDYALEARFVTAFRSNPGLTPVPRCSEIVLGVCNLKGEILAVFDLLRALGCKRSTASDESSLIVLGQKQAEFGVLVEEISQVGDLGEVEEYLESPEGSDLSPCICGITRDGRYLIDGARLLVDRSLFIGHWESELSREPEEEAQR